jgi:hypothetical protein
MKIGIVTFQRSKNYGGVLQAYALYNTVNRLGHTAKMVDYWPSYRREMQYTFPPNFWKLNLKRKITSIVRYVLTFQNLKLKNKRFDEFTYSFLGLRGSEPYLDGEQIEETFDVCLYGSDQVWRSYRLDSLNGIDDFYFGKYPKNCRNKVSYAASMGSLNHERETYEEIGLLLNNFKSISVREKSLQEFLDLNYGINAALVCDPTFLLTKESWREIIPSKRLVSKKYVLFYNLMPSDLGSKVAKEIARINNFEVIELSHNLFNSAVENRISSSAGPLEFLNLVYYSEFVVSSSFHGMAFSIILQKQFFAAGMKDKSDRALTALEFLNLSDRYLNNFEEFDAYRQIDFQKVESKLVKYRESSLSFINQSILK